MDLKSYFDDYDGIGILATCDPHTTVDLAVYSKPLVVDDATIAFAMRQRLSHQNIKNYRQAAYMFIEKGPGYNGVRLYLTMEREESNQSVIEQMRKKQPQMFSADDDSQKYLVFFTIDRIRSLTGDDPL